MSDTTRVCSEVRYIVDIKSRIILGTTSEQTFSWVSKGVWSVKRGLQNVLVSEASAILGSSSLTAGGGKTHVWCVFREKVSTHLFADQHQKTHSSPFSFMRRENDTYRKDVDHHHHHATQWFYFLCRPLQSPCNSNLQIWLALVRPVHQISRGRGGSSWYEAVRNEQECDTHLPAQCGRCAFNFHFTDIDTRNS